MLNSNHDPGLLGQTQPGISISWDIWLPRKECGLGTVHDGLLFPFSSSDMVGFCFNLIQNFPIVEKIGPVGERTINTLYFCCKLKKENKFICNYCKRLVYSLFQGRIFSFLLALYFSPIYPDAWTLPLYLAQYLQYANSHILKIKTGGLLLYPYNVFMSKKEPDKLKKGFASPHPLLF